MDISINEIEPKFDYHQLLLSWFSPNFPIGSYNFSHGLEAAIEMNYIRAVSYTHLTLPTKLAV